MSNPDASEHARHASRARWGNQVVTRAAEVVVERAEELDEGLAGEVMMAVDRTLGWLPARSARLIAAEDREERRAAREAERARSVRAEQAHDAAIVAAAANAELRGDAASIVGLMNGEGVPTVGDVLERARAEAERQDAYAESMRPGGKRPDEIMYPVLMPEPKPAARSETALEAANVRRRFMDRVAARRKADDLDGVRRYLP